MTTQQNAFKQAFHFLSQGTCAKLYREQGQWTCVPMHNTKQMIELEMLK